MQCATLFRCKWAKQPSNVVELNETALDYIICFGFLGKAKTKKKTTKLCDGTAIEFTWNILIVAQQEPVINDITTALN